VREVLVARECVVTDQPVEELGRVEMEVTWVEKWIK